MLQETFELSRFGEIELRWITAPTFSETGRVNNKGRGSMRLEDVSTHQVWVHITGQPGNLCAHSMEEWTCSYPALSQLVDGGVGSTIETTLEAPSSQILIYDLVSTISS